MTGGDNGAHQVLGRFSLVIRLMRAECYIKTIERSIHIRRSAARHRGLTRHVQRIRMPNPNGTIRDRPYESRIRMQMG